MGGGTTLSIEDAKLKRRRRLFTDLGVCVCVCVCVCVWGGGGWLSPPIGDFDFMAFENSTRMERFM